MNVLPFVTPIFWQKAFLKKHFWIVNINPFYHAVEIVRAPLLSDSLNPLSWPFMGCLTIITIALAMLTLAKGKKSLIYWI
jgi:ABC-type polysaccharide/polyol phosphate export permease